MYDIIIIGGGPAGLSAALVLGRCRRSVLLIDAGKPRNADAEQLHGYLGHDGISPQALLESGRQELRQYGVEICDDTATSAECLGPNPQQPEGFVVETELGRSETARKLLFCTGVRDVLPAMPGISACYGISVHHCPYCDGWEHRDQALFAYAASASQATSLGLILRGWSSKITVLTDGDALSAEDKQRLASNGINWETSPVKLVECDSQGQLRSVELANGKSLAGDALFFSSEQVQGSRLPHMVGCRISDRSGYRTSDKQGTNVRGVFLAGDSDGDVQLAVVAAAEGAIAATAINKELQHEDLQ